MKDINNKTLINGDIIDIHQTVNGQNKFVVVSVNPLNIVYHQDLSRKYEYNQEDLLKPDEYTGETTWEIIGNIRGKR